MKKIIIWWLIGTVCCAFIFLWAYTDTQNTLATYRPGVVHERTVFGDVSHSDVDAYVNPFVFMIPLLWVGCTWVAVVEYKDRMKMRSSIV